LGANNQEKTKKKIDHQFNGRKGVMQKAGVKKKKELGGGGKNVKRPVT